MVSQPQRHTATCHLYRFFSVQVTAERGPLHPQEQLGRTISLDSSGECYLLFEDKKFVVKAFRLFHRIPSFGFCIREHDRPGRLKTERLRELGDCTSCMCFFFHRAGCCKMSADCSDMGHMLMAIPQSDTTSEMLREMPVDDMRPLTQR